MFICFVGDTKRPELKLEAAKLTQFPSRVVLKHHCQENIRGEHWAYLARFLKHYSLGCVTHSNKMQPKSLCLHLPRECTVLSTRCAQMGLLAAAWFSLHCLFFCTVLTFSVSAALFVGVER